MKLWSKQSSSSVMERMVIWAFNGFSKKELWATDIALFGQDITHTKEYKEANVIHLHWVNQGFLSLGDLERIMATGKPIVITLHDQWYFTGICHYSGECTKFKSQCTRCPMLTSGGIGMDVAKRVFERKRRIYEGRKVTFVGCSRWMADLARQSRLTQGHNVVNVPNAIDTLVFAPGDRQTARERHGLPADKLLVLFGAQRITDERKGFRYLAGACEHIANEHPTLASDIGIVVLGGDAPSVKESLPLPVYTLDYLSNEDDIAQLYQAVDLFVTPSLQDNLPNTIVEAMACGVPCVGFNVGGIPEMIDHNRNGYVAIYRDSNDFASGIIWCLDNERHKLLCDQARNKALINYSESIVAQRYREVYDSALNDD
jgi:glycosyltransferase involved in cell wall biosynthesis